MRVGKASYASSTDHTSALSVSGAVMVIGPMIQSKSENSSPLAMSAA